MNVTEHMARGMTIARRAGLTQEEVADLFDCSVYLIRRSTPKGIGLPGGRPGKRHGNVARAAECPSRGHLDPAARIARPSAARMYR